MKTQDFMYISVVQINDQIVLVGSNEDDFQMVRYLAEATAPGIRAVLLFEVGALDIFNDNPDNYEVIDLAQLSMRVSDDWRPEARIATLKYYGYESER